jgi:hypothetical protein
VGSVTQGSALSKNPGGTRTKDFVQLKIATN